jgi:hypothetical protein
MKGKAGAGTVRATHIHEPGGLDQTLEFLKRTRSELRQLRRAYAWPDRIHVCDVNRDIFEIVGLGYADPDIIPVFAEVNAAYDPQTIHHPTDAEYKEFNLGRRRPWAEDRVM